MTKPLYDLTSEMYKQAGAQQQAAQGQPNAGAQAGAQQSEAKDEKVVDADYKVVDDDQK